MEQLSTLFPENDFTLLAVILALPLIGAFVNGVFGKRLGKEAVTLMALSAVGLAFVASLVSFCILSHSAGHGEHAEVVHLKWKAWEWFKVSQAGDFGQYIIDVAFSMDQLNGTMS